MTENNAPIVGEIEPLDKPIVGEIEILGPNPEPSNEMSGIKKMANNVANWLPMAGGVIGGAIPLAIAPATGGVSLGAESAAVGLGTAAGVLGKNIIKGVIGEKSDSPIQSTKKAVTEGVMAGGFNIIGGKIIPALAKSAKPMAAQLIKAFEGVDEKTAIRVIKDPDILGRALPMQEAEQKFGEFIQGTGFKYGPEAVESVTGDMQLSPQKALDLTNGIFKKIEQVKGLEKFPENADFIKNTIQEALAARTELSDDITRAFTANLKTKGRFLMGKLDRLDDYLETQIPGYENARIMYSEAKAKEAFSPMLATNKNGSVSVLRSLGAIAQTAYDPVRGIPMMAASSPYVGGKIIQAYGKLSKLPIQKIRNMAASGSAEAIDYLASKDTDKNK